MSSERVRLSALYAGLLLLAGGLLVSLVYVLVQRGLYTSIDDAVRVASRCTSPPCPEEGGVASETTPPVTPAPQGRVAVSSRTLADAAEEAALRDLLGKSLLVFALYGVVSTLLAWWMAGKVLRPVDLITDRARRISGANLHERIGLQGPPGELKRLADTFDAMLERMEYLMLAQKRFAAHAAHELRTPLTVQRAAAEIGLAGAPDRERVARIRAKLLAVADDSERMIEGLLLLASADRGLTRRAPVAVHTAVEEAVAALSGEAAARGVHVSADVAELTVSGDRQLLDRLVLNLLANAVRHNVTGGRVSVRTSPAGLHVCNTGPVVPPEVVPELFEPFRRLTGHGHPPPQGTGLGLSLVMAITRAHGARLTMEANPAPEGGLTTVVRFPDE